MLNIQRCHNKEQPMPKLKLKVGIHSAVATDVIGAGQSAKSQQAQADQFGKLFDEHSGKLFRWWSVCSYEKTDEIASRIG